MVFDNRKFIIFIGIFILILLGVGLAIRWDGFATPYPNSDDPFDNHNKINKIPPVLKIISWNLQHLSTPKQNEDGTVTAGRRTNEDLNLLADYAAKLEGDLLFIQEVSSVEALKRIFANQYDIHISADGRNMKQAILRKAWLVPISQIKPLPSLNINGYLRGGLSLSLSLNQFEVDLLGVHLKSNCHQIPLSRANNKNCATLKAQIKGLKQWMHQRIHKGKPFVIVGDFNRRFDIEPAPDLSHSLEKTPTNWMWPSLFDHEAKGYLAGLVRPNRFMKSLCHDSKYAYFIDHFVMNEPAAALVELGSFKEYFTDLDPNILSRLSDHCPIGLSLMIN